MRLLLERFRVVQNITLAWNDKRCVRAMSLIIHDYSTGTFRSVYKLFCIELHMGVLNFHEK